MENDIPMLEKEHSTTYIVQRAMVRDNWAMWDFVVEAVSVVDAVHHAEAIHGKIRIIRVDRTVIHEDDK